MGLERVAKLNLTMCGHPLVSKQAPFQKRGAKHLNGWYVVTHASTREKRTVLEQVSEQLEVPISVKVMDRGEANLINLLGG